MFVFIFFFLFVCLLGKACAWTLIKCWIWAWSICPETPCCCKHFECSKSWETSHELFSCSWRLTWEPVVGSLFTLCFFRTRETMSALLRNPGWLLRAAMWAVGQHSLLVTRAPPATSPSFLQTNLPRHTSQLVCVHMCVNICELVCVCSGCPGVIIDLQINMKGYLILKLP